MVHIGLGNFHRAHQVWYTAHAEDAAEWGIAAFTGRSPRQAALLEKQDGLYTLEIRDGADTRIEVMANLLEVHDAAEIRRFAELLTDPAVVIVTLTITEAGYAGEGAIDRLVAGLEARRLAGAGAIAIVPCDNVPDNAGVARRVIRERAARICDDLVDWVDREVSIVGTSVDRITPRIEGASPHVLEAGWMDEAPVVTEAFTSWILSGDFPGGRPDWEAAGARFVDDLTPWESRKLWLLNGAHTILAVAGIEAGHTTVAAAIADERVRALVTDFWSEAVRLLPDGIEHEQYRRDLLARFADTRIVHLLSQIAEATTTKVLFRLVPVAEATRIAGGEADASARSLAAWIRAAELGLLPLGEGDKDLSCFGGQEDPLERVSPTLARDAQFRDRIDEALLRLRASARRTITERTK